MKICLRSILCLLLLSGTLLFLGGCRKSVLRERPPGHSPEDTALVDAVLILRCNDLQTKTADRETQERQVNDLNLFFVHKSYPSAAAPEVRHYYFSSADMAKHIKLTNIRLGKYRMYAVANAGKRLCSDSHDPEHPSAVGEGLCSMTEAQIRDLSVRYSQSPVLSGNLLMATENTDVTINRADEVLPTIKIDLERRVAKYDFSYRLVGPAVGRMKVKKVEVKSVPAHTTPFGDNRQVGDNYYNSWTIQNFGDGTLQEVYETCFYLPENMQGDVVGVVGEQDRYFKNAPQYATYLYIDGDYDGAQYGMSIYFGNEMTGGNFDVNGNAYYKLNLELGGPNLNDARVSSMKLEIQNNTFETQPDTWIDMLVKVACSNYFNDQLVLNCNVANPSIGEVNGMFEVYRSDAAGTIGEQLVNKGNYRYDVLSTGDEGKAEVWCVIRYKQSVGHDQVRLSMTIQSRFGAANFKDQVIDFKN